MSTILLEFHSTLLYSIASFYNNRSNISYEISYQISITTCLPFTPKYSVQRSPPKYYRGCWHVVSRGFLVKYCQGVSSYAHTCSSLTTEFYDPKIFIIHAASLRQTFVHCGRFPTAATR